MKKSEKKITSGSTCKDICFGPRLDFLPTGHHQPTKSLFLFLCVKPHSNSLDPLSICIPSETKSFYFECRSLIITNKAPMLGNSFKGMKSRQSSADLG